MKAYLLNEARAEFSKLFDRALAGQPQRVTRHGKEAVMIAAEKEWQSRNQSAPSLGTAVRHGLVLLTRNMGEFGRLAIAAHDPFANFPADP